MADDGDEEDGNSLWAFVTRSVKPLYRDDLLKNPHAKEDKKREDIKKAAEQKTAERRIEPSLFSRAVEKMTGSVQKNLEKNRNKGGIDKNTENKIKRGQMPIEGRIDRHGYRQEEARDALMRFLWRAYDADKRLLIVITGKGYRSHDEHDWMSPRPGVLKRMVPEWLHDPQVSQIILKYYPASNKDGGDGALYVYLRRKKSDTELIL